MRLPSGDVAQWDVMQWALEQAQYLTPTQHHVLLYLCLNAFYQADNPEDAWVSRVLTKRAEQAEIQFYTGLSRRTIYRVLYELQESGYIVYDSSNSPNKPTNITVAWREEMDELRARVRAGTAEFPPAFRTHRREPAVPVVRPLATVTYLDQRRHGDPFDGLQ